ncbi:hypothetical protein HRR83_007692 [Exophiala dermatitidis]|uniref:Uncharacterized protein n=1 Tax=Exophiala dermatitidis TaxID=5970 RepID=A0AAN6EQV6_EXODE|nr:hypothetical protein HRR73_008939 [Exophiala dermatitidis]KAJ4509919.1 hypothetical protein HRR74_007071 [Exophiala dermatitidis]KAJ4539526.1 hypothetical protein HRR77_006408 [Exophiala dermatitidis]KAJ4548393.1 hypothetical protein HRR76_000996 [Exophiala dermatitidis]KAJ4562950.1 hypothetical protein HRR79_006542 [Exophiala dermatitidis]
MPQAFRYKRSTLACLPWMLTKPPTTSFLKWSHFSSLDTDRTGQDVCIIPQTEDYLSSYPLLKTASFALLIRQRAVWLAASGWFVRGLLFRSGKGPRIEHGHANLKEHRSLSLFNRRHLSESFGGRFRYLHSI